jgi:hypothetical protein
MRTLIKEEWLEVLDDNGEPDEGCVAMEFSMMELANRHVGTLCGTVDNECFIEVAKSFPDRMIRGWYDHEEKVMCGMVHIQCTEEESETIENLAEHAEGSLRPNGESLWEGFYEFEIE